jgi:hypothetical protein
MPISTYTRPKLRTMGGASACTASCTCSQYICTHASKHWGFSVLAKLCSNYVDSHVRTGELLMPRNVLL